MWLDKLDDLYHSALGAIKPASGIAPLALRLFLAPVLIQAGWIKIVGFSGTARFFETLGVPLPEVMVFLTAAAEFGGGIFLLFGLATRFVAIPLMVAMLVAGLAVHGGNGWLAISDGSSWLANDRVMAAQEQKKAIRALMREHGDYKWLTENGKMTILNNGMQIAMTYFVMLLTLFFTGGGRYTSCDYWIDRIYHKRKLE